MGKLRGVIRLAQFDAFILVKYNRPGTERALKGLRLGGLSVELLDAIGDTDRIWYHRDGKLDLDAVREVSRKLRAVDGGKEYADLIDRAVADEGNGGDSED